MYITAILLVYMLLCLAGIGEHADDSCKHRAKRIIAPTSTLVSQARPTSAREGKGLVNCVNKPCPGALYSAPQSRCSILSHDALHHCFSNNRSLKNSETELGHLSSYYRNHKNTSRIVF